IRPVRAPVMRGAFSRRAWMASRSPRRWPSRCCPGPTEYRANETRRHQETSPEEVPGRVRLFSGGGRTPVAGAAESGLAEYAAAAQRAVRDCRLRALAEPIQDPWDQRPPDGA